MYDVVKPKSFNVRMRNGKEVQIFREELMSDPTLRSLVTSFDRVMEDVVEAEYKREVAIHAHRSMKSQLEKVLKHYAEEKHGLNIEKGDENGSEN